MVPLNVRCVIIINNQNGPIIFGNSPHVRETLPIAPNPQPRVPLAPILQKSTFDAGSRMMQDGRLHGSDGSSITITSIIVITIFITSTSVDIIVITVIARFR